MDQAALAECTSEELGEALGQVHALENAVRSTLVEVVQACDARKCWVEDGCQTLETWLAMRLRIAWRTAADLVRVARGLEDLPAISSVLESGALSWDKARALATVATICSQALGADADADRATVVVFESADGSLRYPDGSGMPSSVAEYFSCDCREQHPDGSVSSVISASLRRLVLRRDGGCTFPGCEQRHWLHLHHLIWRSRGGPTEAWNLRARCGFHHRVVHQPGWRERVDADGTVHIYRPDGTEVGVDPPEPIRPELRHRLEDWLAFRGTHPPDEEWRDTG